MRVTEFDILQLAFVAAAFAAVLLLISVGYIALQNKASQTLVLATAAVLGTLVVYTVNLLFELRGTKTADHITVEVTIDRLKQRIGQWDPGSNYMRMATEQFASEWLAANHPDEFTSDGDKLTKDLILFALINFLVEREHDWQISKVSFKGRGLQTWQGLSKPDECTEISEQELKTLLSKAGNIFANGPVRGFRKLCLPPNSHLDVTSDSLVMRSPICQLTFHVDDPSMIDNTEPKKVGEGPRVLSVPELPKGGPRFTTRLQGLSVESKFFATRAHHPEKTKYQEWLSRVTNDAHTWFEGA